MPRKGSDYDFRWARLRAKFLKVHPMCMVVGCGERSEHADHIITVKAAPERRLDWRNLQALCERHHSALTRAYDDGKIDGACDKEGQPIDPNHPWNLPTAEAIEVANKHRKADPAMRARLKRTYVTGKNR